jgi:hypothetical protein
VYMCKKFCRSDDCGSCREECKMWLRRCSPEARLPRDGKWSSEFEALRRILADGCRRPCFLVLRLAGHICHLRKTPADSFSLRRLETFHYFSSSSGKLAWRKRANKMYFIYSLGSFDHNISKPVIWKFISGAQMGGKKYRDIYCALSPLTH